MKFLCYYEIMDGKAAETRTQFTTTEEKWHGIELVARYHSANSRQGVVILETDNPEALASWAMQWDHSIRMDIHPCNDDDGAVAAIQAS